MLFRLTDTLEKKKNYISLNDLKLIFRNSDFYTHVFIDLPDTEMISIFLLLLLVVTMRYSVTISHSRKRNKKLNLSLHLREITWVFFTHAYAAPSRVQRLTPFHITTVSEKRNNKNMSEYNRLDR